MNVHSGVREPDVERRTLPEDSDWVAVPGGYYEIGARYIPKNHLAKRRFDLGDAAFIGLTLIMAGNMFLPFIL